MKANMDYGELLNSMTVEDAAEVLRNTRCYGTMDIAKNVILKALEQKTGHWTHDGGYWKNRWICSECGYKLYAEQSKYCPNCGSYNGGKK